MKKVSRQRGKCDTIKLGDKEKRKWAEAHAGHQTAFGDKKKGKWAEAHAGHRTAFGDK